MAADDNDESLQDALERYREPGAPIVTRTIGGDQALFTAQPLHPEALAYILELADRADEDGEWAIRITPGKARQIVRAVRETQSALLAMHAATRLLVGARIPRPGC